MAAFMLAGALSWIGRWYRPDGGLTPGQVADQGIELLLGGLLQRPASAPVPAPAPATAPRKPASRKGKTA
jgi:hypothetical protein